MDNIPQIVTMASMVLVLVVLLLGFLAGLRRGWKRAVLHLGFGIVAVICAVFLTRGTTSKILGMTFTIGGEDVVLSDYILSLLGIDLTNLSTANEFVSELPGAILNPILFIAFALIVYFVFHIIYLIVSRIFFGSKKEDFKIKNHKPRRLVGSAIGMLEGALLLIVIVSPLITLTNTYEEIVTYSTASTQVSAVSATNEGESGSSSNRLSTISEMISSSLPDGVNDGIIALNDSILGKISAITGVGDVMFDTLSDIKIDGQKISIRTEIVTVCQTYDEFVVFYNCIVDADYQNLDFTNLKDSLTKVLDNNLFKVVISNTLNDFIENYDVMNEQYDLDSKLGDFTYLIQNLKEKCQTADFSMYDYLKSDLLTVLDVMEDAVESELVQKIKETESFDIETVLNLLEGNSDFVKRSMNSIFGLNLVKDSMSSLARVMSSKLASYDLDGVTLNPNMTDEQIENMSDSLSVVIDYLADLDISGVVNIIKADDKLTAIANLTNIEDTLILMGQILDELDNMPLLNYTDSETHQNVNALTNLLNTYDLNLLGDSVYYNEGDTALTTLDSYTEFFTYIAGPLSKISDAGLLEIVASGSFEFDEIKPALIDAICGKDGETGNSEFIADILMPFYHLDTYAKFGSSTLKDLVFNEVIDTLDTELKSFVNITPTGSADIYEAYKANLTSVGELIVVLNGVYTTDPTEQTYLDYLLSTDPDYLKLVKKMNSVVDADTEKSDLFSMLEIVFGNDMYSPLYSTLFTTIDKAVLDITNVNPNTLFADEEDQDPATYETLKSKSDTYVSTICDIIDAVADYKKGTAITEQLELVGELLDSLKDGAKDGVFVEVFENLIWYLTGDVIDDSNESTYARQDPNKYSSYVKNYLGVADAETGYYSIVYADVMADAQVAVSLADSMTTKLDELVSSVNLETTDGKINFIETIYDAITDTFTTDDTLDSDTAVKVINDLIDLDVDFSDVVTLGEGKTIADYSTDINSAIDYINSDQYEGSIDEDIADALKDFFSSYTSQSAGG